ncbi:MAG: methyltransferase, TIGR04325 family, partial [Caldimonas sp.]
MAPPVVMSLFRRWSGHALRFAGTPADWTQAMSMSDGYDDAVILDRVRQATRAVVSGQARYERDAVLFDEPDFPFAVIAALLRAAALDRGRLQVIDFGGSLGSTYRQCRPLLDGLADVRWCIVEQPAFVEAGRTEFTTDELHFARSLGEVSASGQSGVILASSVLQYLQDPHSVLREFAAAQARHLIIDRT